MTNNYTKTRTREWKLKDNIIICQNIIARRTNNNGRASTVFNKEIKSITKLLMLKRYEAIEYYKKHLKEGGEIDYYTNLAAQSQNADRQNQESGANTEMRQSDQA